LIAAYLTAIIAANLIVTWLGAWVTPLTAFAFIGLDITARDHLHDAWSNKGLFWKMGSLIAAGSFISWAVNRNAGRVALASFVAFVLSATTDTIVYSIAARQGLAWIWRSNSSNLASAAVDSFVFPTLAFGCFMPCVVLGQFLAKVFGGALWSVLLHWPVHLTSGCSRPLTSTQIEMDLGERGG